MHTTGGIDERLLRWKEQLERALRELRTIDLGYEQGENAVWPPDRDPGVQARVRDRFGADSAVAAFYSICDGFSLGDVHVGYFVDRAARMLTADQRGEPVRLGRPDGPQITVFGSDGGGGRFALQHPALSVLYLPMRAVHDGVYEGDPADVRILGDDLLAFLNRVLEDVRAFVEGRENWSYIA